MPETLDYDYVIIGSGFGGSVSALRLSEKGYKVLVLEKGKKYEGKDFPKSNWVLNRWLWLPGLKFFGIMKMTFFRHVSILSGVGVGGGSLVYANTLPIPKDYFFKSKSWSHLADWKTELLPFYDLARKMLGTAKNPRLEKGDLALQELGKQIGKGNHFEPTDVAIFFGEPNRTVPDPYFNGEGPERTGCNFCGGCMIGCKHNSKNTLDKNYLYLAQKKGAEILPEKEVYDVKPLNGNDGSTGYRIFWRESTKFFGKRGEITTRGVIFSGGVLGTVDLLLKLKKSSLPNLSNKLGTGIRTNSESIIPITSLDKKSVYSDGIAIGSILHTDDHSHLEPVRYSEGSGFWRLLLLPLVDGRNNFVRFFKLIYDFFRHPIQNLKVMFTDDWSKRTQVLLFMQSLESTLRFKRGLFGMGSSMDTGEAPKAFIPEAVQLAKSFSQIIGGKPTVLANEAILGIPSTAHILGGAIMGKDVQEGVIDKENHVFGYENMLVCDGSMISANIGVNPSLTITALSERAMSRIPAKSKS
ncbi:MAG: GMC family oxidoreductase [Leptospiraceae bacterium]|nr:GMC family oxidoreductase [Leptospiraceae bacterium]